MRTILLLLPILLAVTSFAQSIEELTKTAYDFESEKKFEEAISVYNKILKKDTSHYQTYVNNRALFT